MNYGSVWIFKNTLWLLSISYEKYSIIRSKYRIFIPSNYLLLIWHFCKNECLNKNFDVIKQSGYKLQELMAFETLAL